MDKNKIRVNKRKFVLIFSAVILFLACISTITFAWVNGNLKDNHASNSPFISVSLTDGTTNISSIYGNIDNRTLTYNSTTKTASSEIINAPIVLKNTGNINLVFDFVYISIEFYNSEADAQTGTNAIGVSNSNVGGGFYVEIVNGSNFSIQDNSMLTSSSVVAPNGSIQVISGIKFNSIDENSELMGKFFRINIMAQTHQENV